MVLIIMVWSFFLYMYLNSVQGFTDHEIFQYWPGRTLSEMICNEQWRKDIESNGIIPQLFYRLIWVNGDEPVSEFYMRFPVMVCSLLTIYGVFWFGTYMYGQRLGLCSAFLMAINTLYIAYAVHCRFYMFNSLGLIISTFIMFSLARKHSLYKVYLYCLSLVYSICSMVLSIPVLGAHFIYYIIVNRKDRRAYRILTCLILLAIAVFGFLCWRDQSAYNRFDYAPSWENLWRTFVCSLFTQGFSKIDYLSLFDNRDIWLSLADKTFYIILMTTLLGISIVLFRSIKYRKFDNLFIIVLSFTSLYLGYLLIGIFIKPVSIRQNMSPFLVFLPFILSVAIDKKILRICFFVFLLLMSNIICLETLIDGESIYKLKQVVEYYRKPEDLVLIDDESIAKYYYSYGEAVADPLKRTSAGKNVLKYAWGDTNNNFLLLPNKSLIPMAYVQAYNRSVHRIWIVKSGIDKEDLWRLQNLCEARGYGFMERSTDRANMYLIVVNDYKKVM